MKNRLSILIINYKTKELTDKCIESVLLSSPSDLYHIYLLDNASNDGSYDFFKKKYKDNAKISLYKSNENLGFAGGNNYLYQQCKNSSDYYLLLNSDTFVKRSFVDELLIMAGKNKIDIASPKILNSDGSLQPNTGELPILHNILPWISGIDDVFRIFRLVVPSYQQMNKKFYDRSKKVGWVSGTAMLISNNVLEKIGLFDDEMFMYAEDVEFCFRANKNGFDVKWLDSPVVYHYGGASSKNIAKYNQWIGEQKGLLYIYQKHFGKYRKIILKILLKIFTFIRVIAFLLLFKFEYARIYKKVFINL